MNLLHSTCPNRYHRKGYPKYKETFGKDQAMKILQNEKVCGLLLLVGSNGEMNLPWWKETLALLTQVAEKENIDCDLWRGQSFGSQDNGIASILRHSSSSDPQMLR